MPALLLAMALTGLSATAQDLIPEQNEKGKWGYVDQNGSWVIKPKFQYAGQFENGRAKVGKDDKFGYIDTTGKEIIKIDYTEIGVWENGTCKVAKGGERDDDGILKDQKYGYINTLGKELLKCDYDEIGSFNEFGLAYVLKDDKYGYIRKSDLSFAIPCEFKAVGLFNSSGLCWVGKGGDFADDEPSRLTGCKIGIYDKDGKVVIPVKFYVLGYWEDGAERKAINLTDMPDEIMIDLANRYNQTPDAKEAAAHLQGAKQEKARNQFNQGNAFGLHIDPTRSTYFKFDPDLMSQTLLVTTYFKELSETTTLDYHVLKCYNFSKLSDNIKNGYIVCIDGEAALYNLDGKELLPPKFIGLGFPGEKYAAVSTKSGQWNIYDLETKSLMSKKGIKGNLHDNYRDGVLIIKNTLKTKKNQPPKHEFNIVDSQTLQTCSNTYDSISEGLDGHYIVMRDSLYGIIDFSGKEILAPEYRVIQHPIEGLFCVKKGPDDLFGFVDGSGNYVIEPQYDYAFQFHNGIAIVKKNGKWGIIDKQNNTLVDFKWACIYPQENTSLPFWVYDSTSWHALDLATGQFLFSEGVDLPISNFGEEGFAVVANSESMLGVISASGEMLIPYAMHHRRFAIDCYRQFRDQGQTTVDATEAHRYEAKKINANLRLLLSTLLPTETWDY